MPAATDISRSTPRSPAPPALPDEVLMAVESQWIFTESELLRSPSILDGLTPEKERENRSKGVNFILQVGIMLKLPQITLATASVFLHRFYMRRSMVDAPGKPGYHYYSMAATSLFLATKVEENCRKMKELVIACVRVAQKDPLKMVDEQDREYWRWRDNILIHEDLLLEVICFDLSLEPPYKTLYDLLVLFQEENNKKLRNAAWAFINDSCLTTLCLLFPSRTIATSALYAAARYAGVAFPDDQQERPWWEVIGVDIGDIRRACNYMAEIYEGAPTKPGRESGLYDRTPETGDDCDDRTRLAGSGSGSRRSSGFSMGGEERKALKREKEDDMEEDEQPQINGGTMGSSNGTKDESNRHVNGSPGNDETNNSEETLRQELPSDHKQQSDRERPNGVQEADHGSQSDEAAVAPVESADACGLVSPKLDEVSEEGEVEP